MHLLVIVRLEDQTIILSKLIQLKILDMIGTNLLHGGKPRARPHGDTQGVQEVQYLILYTHFHQRYAHP